MLVQFAVLLLLFKKKENTQNKQSVTLFIATLIVSHTDTNRCPKKDIQDVYDFFLTQ